MPADFYKLVYYVIHNVSINLEINVSMNPKICAYALGHLNHQLEENKIAPCFRCRAKIGDHSTQFMSEVKNSPEARLHRMTLMRGEWPEGCASCKDFEDNGVISTRLEGLGRSKELGLDLNNYNSITGEINNIKSIELRFGNECNLTCRHCGPDYSSKWEAIFRYYSVPLKTLSGRDYVDPIKSSPSQEYLKDILDNVVPTLEHIAFAGGETLYQQKHYEFIAAIPEEHAAHIQLMYVTNGTILTHKKYNVLELWKKFKKVRVVVSTDGIKDQFNYFRQGANWDIVEHNMRAFKAAGYWVGTEITCSIYQLFYLTETIDYLYDGNFSDWVSTSIVQYPQLLNPRLIPVDAKKMLIEKWETYLSSITDSKKLDHVKQAGDLPMKYMEADHGHPYYADGSPQTWQEFANSVYACDKLFNTSVDRSFPLLAKWLPTAQ